jgi:hypothetical protein
MQYKVHIAWLQYGACVAYRIFSTVFFIFPTLFLLTLGLSGCTETPTPYRPPSITSPVSTIELPAETLDSVSQPGTMLLTPTNPDCTDNLTLLKTVSIPDGTIVREGERVDKRWLVQNSGSCNWDSRYRLKSNADMGISIPTELALYPARSGSTANIRIFLKAPSSAGTYQAKWQAYDPSGIPFGDRLTLRIVVDSTSP